MLFNFKCKTFLFKDFPHPVALYVWGTDGTKACDRAGKTVGLCELVTFPNRLKSHRGLGFLLIIITKDSDYWLKLGTEYTSDIDSETK